MLSLIFTNEFHRWCNGDCPSLNIGERIGRLGGIIGIGGCRTCGGGICAGFCIEEPATPGGTE